MAPPQSTGVMSFFLSRHHPILSRLLKQKSSSVCHVKRVHAQLITAGLSHHPFAASHLISATLSFSSSPSSLRYADLIFHHTENPTLFTFNTLIKAHSFPSSLVLFQSILRNQHGYDEILLPNQYTFVFLLDSTGLGLQEVEQIQGQILRRGLDSNVYVANVLVRVYGLVGRTEIARKIFDEIRMKDMVSWNSLLGGYVSCGDIDQARKVFDVMPIRDVVSWTTTIAGYVQVGCFIEALELFREMQSSGVMANEFTLTSVLAACANLVALDQGKWVHAYLNKARIKVNERLLAGLVDMYAKCGEVDVAFRVFEEGQSKQTARPWNAIISGFAIHGRSHEAIGLFEKMRKIENVVPDKVTFISLLHACSHGKLVDEGRYYFDLMKTYEIEAEIEHYGCMVDILGRAGRLREAEEFVSVMPMPPDTIVWGTLLAACRIHGDVEMVERIGNIIARLDPNYVGCQVLLANIYSKSGRWNDARDVRNKIELTGAKKIPGCSSIELNGMFHQFLVGDRSHPQTKRIYSFLDEMTAKLKIAGYLPETREVLLDIDEEDKETALSRHSEKLAIAFGLLNTVPGVPIRIVKNLRVCMDCHHATKFISKVYNREIIVRDRIRFHHFKDGSCSCKDYW